MKSIGSNPRNDGARGDERIRTAVPDGTNDPEYVTVVADPPWPYTGEVKGTRHPTRTGRKSMGVRVSYPTMSIAEIAALRPPVPLDDKRLHGRVVRRVPSMGLLPQDDLHLREGADGRPSVDENGLLLPWRDRALDLRGSRVAVARREGTQ